MPAAKSLEMSHRLVDDMMLVNDAEQREGVHLLPRLTHNLAEGCIYCRRTLAAGELAHQFRPKKEQELRIGHTVMLAEILAQNHVEIGALIPPAGTLKRASNRPAECLPSAMWPHPVFQVRRHQLARKCKSPGRDQRPGQGCSKYRRLHGTIYPRAHTGTPDGEFFCLHLRYSRAKPTPFGVCQLTALFPCFCRCPAEMTPGTRRLIGLQACRFNVVTSPLPWPTAAGRLVVGPRLHRANAGLAGAVVFGKIRR